MITSTSNVQIKQIIALMKKSKERKEQKAFVIEGRKMFEEICQDTSRIVRAYFSESYVKDMYTDRELPKIPHEIVADSVFDANLGKVHGHRAHIASPNLLIAKAMAVVSEHCSTRSGRVFPPWLPL